MYGGAEPVWFAFPGHQDLSSASKPVLAASQSPLAAFWSVRPEQTLPWCSGVLAGACWSALYWIRGEESVGETGLGLVLGSDSEGEKR